MGTTGSGGPGQDEVAFPHQRPMPQPGAKGLTNLITINTGQIQRDFHVYQEICRFMTTLQPGKRTLKCI